MRDELRRATEPTGDEVERFLEPLDPGLLEACAEATSPSPVELRLRPRARARRGLPSPAWALAAALVLLALWIGAGPSSRPRAARWVVDDPAAIHVLQADPPQVEVLRGVVIDVPPGEPMVVHAGEVRIKASGARFSVLPSPTEVRVERGRVEVSWPEGMVNLGPGGVWIEPRPNPAPRVEQARPVLAAVAPKLATPPSVPTPGAEPASGPDLTHAALAWAVLQDRYRMGERDAALLADIDHWLEQNPDSLLREQTEVLRLELIAATLPPRRAAAELEAWLAAHPDSPRRLEVLYRLGHVARVGLQDCDRAMQSYQVVAREHPGDLGELSREWLDWCLEE